jgi:hypothetical protein
MFWSQQASAGLVAEWQILFNTIKVGGSDQHRFAQRPSPFGTLALKQMAPARASAEHFSGPGYLESFDH